MRPNDLPTRDEEDQEMGRCTAFHRVSRSNREPCDASVKTRASEVALSTQALPQIAPQATPQAQTGARHRRHMDNLVRDINALPDDVDDDLKEVLLRLAKNDSALTACDLRFKEIGTAPVTFGQL